MKILTLMIALLAVGQVFASSQLPEKMECFSDKALNSEWFLMEKRSENTYAVYFTQYPSGYEPYASHFKASNTNALTLNSGVASIEFISLTSDMSYGVYTYDDGGWGEELTTSPIFCLNL